MISMGRSNYVLLGIGLAAMVALSLMMNFALEATEKRVDNEIQRQLVLNFSDRVDGEIKFDLTPCPGGKRAVVTARPDLGVPQKGFARDIGQFVWRETYEERSVVQVHVVCLGSGPEPARFEVPSPYSLARHSSPTGMVRRLSAEEQSAVSAPAKPQAAK